MCKITKIWSVGGSVGEYSFQCWDACGDSKFVNFRVEAGLRWALKRERLNGQVRNVEATTFIVFREAFVDIAHAHLAHVECSRGRHPSCGAAKPQLRRRLHSDARVKSRQEFRVAESAAQEALLFQQEQVSTLAEDLPNMQTCLASIAGPRANTTAAVNICKSGSPRLGA